jgi:hypothetical protein
MQQEAVPPPSILDYAGPATAVKPRRWWLLTIVLLGVFSFEDILPPRSHPPGWPENYDYVLMLSIPIGGLLICKLTSLPGWALGFYGLGAGCSFFLAQARDTQFSLDTREAVIGFVINWSMFLVGSWLICRIMVFARGRPAA